MLKVIEYFTLQMAKLRFKVVPPVDDLKKELIKPETLTQVVVPWISTMLLFLKMSGTSISTFD